MSEKDKILVYVHGWFIHFGIAKALQEKYPCDIFGIVDFDDKAKKFFDNQKIVDFTKYWHYKEHANVPDTKPDMEYLKEFESKYSIDIWSIVYTDKSFYKYNLSTLFPYLFYFVGESCICYDCILSFVSANATVNPNAVVHLTTHHFRAEVL